MADVQYGEWSDRREGSRNKTRPWRNFQAVLRTPEIGSYWEVFVKKEYDFLISQKDYSGCLHKDKSRVGHKSSKTGLGPLFWASRGNNGDLH